MKTFFPFIILALLRAEASTQKDLPPVGVHYPIITFEKNENPQNIMVIYTRLSSDCHVEADPKEAGRPVFAFYWLMDRTRYKPVHSLIQSGIRKRLRVGTLHPEGFSVDIADLEELKADIKDPTLKVNAKKDEKGCSLEATIQLGPSDGNALVRLNSIYSEARKSFWPPFRKLVSVRLDGVDVKTGSPVHRTYSGK